VADDSGQKSEVEMQNVVKRENRRVGRSKVKPQLLAVVYSFKREQVVQLKFYFNSRSHQSVRSVEKALNFL
jgi:hypothetical protein